MLHKYHIICICSDVAFLSPKVVFLKYFSWWYLHSLCLPFIIMNQSVSVWERDGIPKGATEESPLKGLFLEVWAELREPTRGSEDPGTGSIRKLWWDCLCSKCILHCQLCDNGSEPFKYFAQARGMMSAEGRGLLPDWWAPVAHTASPVHISCCHCNFCSVQKSVGSPGGVGQLHRAGLSLHPRWNLNLDGGGFLSLYKKEFLSRLDKHR